MKPFDLGHVEIAQGVAPRTGAWIETRYSSPDPSRQSPSPPARGRGLKHAERQVFAIEGKVAPRTGAWIETLAAERYLMDGGSRPPHGGVD